MKGIYCEKKVYNNKTIKHSHPYAQLVLSLCGTMEVEIGDTSYIADDSNLFLLPYNQDHTYKVTGKNQFLIMDIDCQLFNDELYGGIKCSLDGSWKAIRFLLLDEMRRGNADDAISKLYYYFMPKLLELNVPESVQFLRQHYNEHLKIDTLAGIENYSAKYYSEWFEKKMGCPPVDYIRRLRLERAKELLCSTNLSIIQIAYEVGYIYESSFTRLFTTYENVSPKKYRLLNG